MVYCNEGKILFKGSRADLMADMATLFDAMIKDKALDVNDVMYVVECAFEQSNVTVIRGNDLPPEALDELMNLMKGMSGENKELEKDEEVSSDDILNALFKDLFNNEKED